MKNYLSSVHAFISKAAAVLFEDIFIIKRLLALCHEGRKKSGEKRGKSQEKREGEVQVDPVVPKRHKLAWRMVLQYSVSIAIKAD